MLCGVSCQARDVCGPVSCVQRVDSLLYTQLDMFWLLLYCERRRDDSAGHLSGRIAHRTRQAVADDCIPLSQLTLHY